MIRETSLEAYQAIMQGDLMGPFQREVYSILYEFGPMTAGEAAMKYQARHPLTHRGRNEVAKRIYELVKFTVVKECLERECRATGFTCYTWDVTMNHPVKRTKDDKIKCPTCNGKGHIVQRNLF